MKNYLLKSLIHHSKWKNRLMRTPKDRGKEEEHKKEQPLKMILI